MYRFISLTVSGSLSKGHKIKHLCTVEGINVIKTDYAVFRIHIGNIRIGNSYGIGSFGRTKCKDTEFIRSVSIRFFLREYRAVRFVIIAVRPPEDLYMAVSVQPF